MLNSKMFLLLSLVSASALAFDPAPIPMGDSDLVPQLGVSYFSNSNVFAARDDETESTGVKIKPELQWVADKGLSFVSLGYRGDYTRFSDVDNRDYNDHTYELDSRLEFNSRSKLSLDISFKRGHEEPGFGLSTSYNPVAESVLKYDSFKAAFLYYYGAETARGGLEFGLDSVSVDFTNNKSATEGYNRKSIIGSATFLYTISGAVKLTSGLELDTTDYDKRLNFAELDNQKLFAFIGSRWDLTGKSGGTIQVGYGNRSFSANSRDDDSTFQLRLVGFWYPLRHSHVELEAHREFVVEVASPSVKDSFLLDWTYDWSSRVASHASVDYITLNSDFDPDDQKSLKLSAGLDVSLSRWMALTLTAENFDRTSSNEGWEFGRQIYTVGLKLSL